MSQDQTEETVYYFGKTLTGTRYHTGHEVIPYVNDDQDLVVRTHCGNTMLQWDEGERPPAYDEENEDLCKICHRSYAWSVMKDAIFHRRQVENELARKLDRLAWQAETTDIGAIGLVRGIRSIAGELRRSLQAVPSDASARDNLRVVRDAS
jgi:hypothetical protein